MDDRIKKVANIIVVHSTKIKKGEYVQIIGDYDAKDMVLEVYKQALLRGAYPNLHISVPGQAYTYYKHASEEQLKHFPKLAMHEMKNTDAVIFIGASRNTKELANIDPKRMAKRQKALEPIFRQRSEKTKWVIFYYPTGALAQNANMSIEEFSDFVFGATIVDYKKMSRQQEKLKKLIDRGKQIRIVTRNTDIKFNIKGRKGVKCDGIFNLPDGEVFTSPVENSAEGVVEFSYPALYQGREVEGIRLEFKKGKVVKAAAAKNEAFLKAVLNTDKGSKYVGEVGIGVNYKINKFVKNVLFDEKIGGTVHIALGKSYTDAGGKNESAIHWDILTDMKKEGRIYIDGKLIQKNGKFLI
jgi:aminopeptidase